MHLHIILPDIPYPTRSGVDEDRYHRLQALAGIGVKLILHAFTTGREEITPELYDLSEEVHLYPVKGGFRTPRQRLPKALHIRQHPDLLRRLCCDDVPLLFEGMASTYYLSHPEFTRRLKLVRLPRIEWQYQQFLQHFPSAPPSPSPSAREIHRWQQLEATLPYATHLLPMSPLDEKHYRSQHPQATYLPPFHGHNRMSARAGRGKFWLYHGDLGRADNHAAAMLLLKDVFQSLSIPLTVAGRAPQPELITLISQMDQATLVPNPGQGQLADLLHQAHGHVLPSFFAGGIPLKLVHSLFTGRFVVVSPQMVEQTGLAFGTHVAPSPAAMQRLVFDLWHQEFSDIDLAQRQAALQGRLNDRQSALYLVELIRGE